MLEVEARLNQALDLLHRLEIRLQIGRASYELTNLALNLTNAANSCDYFSRALVIFEEIKAIPDMARTRSALESLN